MDSKGCPKCPHDDFLIRCRICNGNLLCVHGRIFELCSHCEEVKKYRKD